MTRAALIMLALLCACPGGKSKSIGSGPGSGGSVGGVDAGLLGGGGAADAHRPECRDRPGDPLPSCLGGDGESEPPIPDDMHVVGAIPKDTIHKTIRHSYASIRYCYENLVVANPGLAGKLTVKFTVGIDGTVLDAAASGIHPDLETCVATEIKKLKFPRKEGAGSVEVSYPFTFSP